MYVRDIHIQNVKLLRDVRLSFLRGDEERMWTVLIGENGLGKTTILQCIALAASGRDRANQLADLPAMPDRRSPQLMVLIDAILSFGQLYHSERDYPQQEFKFDMPPRLISRLTVSTGNFVMAGFSAYGEKIISDEIHRLVVFKKRYPVAN